MVETGSVDINASPPAYTNEAVTDDDVYGQLILLGFNGIQENKMTTKRYQTKMTLRRRDQANGIKKNDMFTFPGLSSENKLVQDKAIHTVSFQCDSNCSIIMEYGNDTSKDMFQIGRASDDQIDFTVIDTWMFLPSDLKNARCLASDATTDRTSTISRFACRILIDRENCNKAYLYAAGFDSHRNISVNQKAHKWTKSNGEMDGLTTNGVLILHPTKDDLNEERDKSMFQWHEVSINGDVFEPRVTRSSQNRGAHVPDLTNMLQDGTLIDLCGATILWRTVEGLERSPKLRELEMALDRLNAGKPQCPVNLNTLVIPKKKSSRGASSRQAYVYLQCGHVQGKHDWGVVASANGQLSGKCPICLMESERIIQLTMGMEPSFHLDSGSLDHAFNPCGHVASKQTVLYWSRIPLPQGTCRYDPMCPFCYQLLATEKPYVRLIFQDHCFDDDTMYKPNQTNGTDMTA